MVRHLLDVVGGVAHGDRDSTFSEHRQIVLHVADGGDGLQRDARRCATACTKVPLLQPGGVTSR